MQDASRRGEASCEQGLRGLAVGIIALSHAADAFLQPQFMLGFGQGGIRLLFMLEGLASGRLHAQPGSQITVVSQLRRLLELVPLYVVLTFLYRPPAGADLLHAMFHGIDHLWAVQLDMQYRLLLCMWCLSRRIVPFLLPAGVLAVYYAAELLNLTTGLGDRLPLPAAVANETMFAHSRFFALPAYLPFFLVGAGRSCSGRARRKTT